MSNPMLSRLPQSSAAAQGTTPETANATGNAGPMSPMSQIKQAMDYVRSNGGDARTAFYRLAQQKGVDPESVLRGLR